MVWVISNGVAEVNSLADSLFPYRGKNTVQTSTSVLEVEGLGIGVRASVRLAFIMVPYYFGDL